MVESFQLLFADVKVFGSLLSPKEIYTCGSWHAFFATCFFIKKSMNSLLITKLNEDIFAFTPLQSDTQAQRVVT